MTAPWYGFTPQDFPTRSVSVSPYYCNGAAGNSARCEYGVVTQDATTTDYIQSPQQTARTDGASGIYRLHGSTQPSAATLLSWLNSAGIEVVRVQTTATATFQLQYWNGATWTAVGAATAITGSASVGFRWQLDFTGLGTGSGSLHLRAIRDTDETTMMDVSGSGLTLTSATNIDRCRAYCTNSASTAYLISEAFIRDGSAMATYGYGSRFTSNGTDTGGTGTYTSIDDANVSTPDTDFISLGSSGVRQSFKAPARSFGGRVVKQVTFPVRMRCGATGVTQVKPYLLIGGTRYYHASSPVTLTTTFAEYSFAWDTDPSTSAAWAATNAQAAATEFGIEVV